MTLKVRTVHGDCLILGDISSCFVAWAELSPDKKALRYWHWLSSKGRPNKQKLIPAESLVPHEWYKSGKRRAQIARLTKTDGSLQLVVFAEDAVLLNAAGREIMHY